MLPGLVNFAENFDFCAKQNSQNIMVKIVSEDQSYFSALVISKKSLPVLFIPWIFHKEWEKSENEGAWNY